MLCVLIFCEIKRWLPSHILQVSKIQVYIKNLVINLVAAFKILKIHKRVCLCLLRIQERSNPWTKRCPVVMIVSFLLKVAIGCQWSKLLLCKLQFFHSGFGFTLWIARLNPPQVFYRFGFPGLSYHCVLYFPHLSMI